MVTASEVQGMVKVDGITVMPFHPSHMDRVVKTQREMEVFDAMPDFRQRLEVLRQNKTAWTFFYKYEPSIIMGIEHKWDTNAEIWMVTGNFAGKHGAILSRGAKRLIDQIGSRLDLLRLQAVVNVDHEKAVRWAEFLGFEREGLMSKYGPEGADYYMYSRTY